MIKCYAKRDVKRSIQSVDIYVKGSNSLIGRKNVGAKTQEPDC